MNMIRQQHLPGFPKEVFFLKEIKKKLSDLKMYFFFNYNSNFKL